MRKKWAAAHGGGGGEYSSQDPPEIKDRVPPPPPPPRAIPRARGGNAPGEHEAPEDLRGLVKELREFGHFWPVTFVLSYDAQLIRAQLAYLKVELAAGFKPKTSKVGVLVYRVEHNAVLPESGRPPDVPFADDDPRRYLGGRYAHLVKH